MTPDRADPQDDPAARERFEVLAQQVVDPLRRYLARRTDPATADDVLSETLVVCWRRVAEVPDEAPVAWAVGVARNCLANAERAGRRRWTLARRVAHVDPPVQRVPGPGETTAEQDAAEQAASAVGRAMSGLGPKDAEVLRLWAWEEMAPAQIAVVLDISVNAATVRLHRAKKRVRAALETQEDDPAGPRGTPRGTSWGTSRGTRTGGQR